MNKKTINNNRTDQGGSILPIPVVQDDGRTRNGRRRLLFLSLLVLVMALVTFGVTGLLVTIIEHRQEARTPFIRLVEVDEASTDPVPWGTNWPHQFDTYRQAVDEVETQFGGSSAMPESKLERSPWLRRLYAGYAFSIDYREARGHAYMLYDQEVTERVTKRTQSGACLHCHASVIPTYRRLGLEAAGLPADAAAVAAGFAWPAVMEGFRIAGTMDYATAHAELLKTPDGTPGEQIVPLPRQSDERLSLPTQAERDRGHASEAHPVSCIDCHDPRSMQIRVTRPGFVLGIAALARSDEPVPHLASIERWREGKRDKPYDPNVLASRQEMRSFVCGQCHVEYYCASKETLFFPWSRGLKVDQVEQTYDEHVFPDGTPFFDYVHGETGAPVYKAQHPEFELWSQGIHARSGVSCADCHMPYERQGAMKVSSHWVRSPLLSISKSCQSCHRLPEQELRDRVLTIQSRTQSQLDRAAAAMSDMLDAIREAQAAGATPEQLADIFELQKKGMWRLDFISSENSLGFHADQEAVRILGESIDYCRQAQAMAVRLLAPRGSPGDSPSTSPVPGIAPAEPAP
jgi:nitrite reductase (cytochrome c-552)